MSPPPIPQADPRAGYLEQKTAIDAAIARVLTSGRYILGEEGAAFEAEFARFAGVRRAVAVASGTAALALGLKALGVGPGDGVVTVSHTAVATVAAIELTGAVPVLADVEADSFNLSPEALQAVLERPPVPLKAVIPVHLYGRPASIQDIAALAARFGVAVLEDASQAHGASAGGRSVGAFGAAAAFSLYPTKNLGALGDAGVLATDDEALADQLVLMRQYGWRAGQVSELAGDNSRLDEMQAAILRVKLERLAEHNARRRAIARAYDAGLAGLPLVRPGLVDGHVFHQYVVRLQDRERVRRDLAAAGVGTGVHYPLPVHRQPAYEGRVLAGPTGLAVTEALSPEILSLPIYPQLGDEAVQRVIGALRGSLG